jgi:hypothetical protein
MVPEILAKRLFLADIEVVLYLIEHIVWKPVLVQHQLLKHHPIRLYYIIVVSVHECGHILYFLFYL